MARRNRAAAENGERPFAGLFEGVHWGRLLLWLAVGMVLMVSTLFAIHATEDFLIKDSHFRIAEAEDLRGHSPNLVVEGVHYASATQIRHVFAPDLGKSLYLVPIQTRREQLLEIDWVQDASVSKIWPDTLRVWIRERQPVAFVRMPSTRGKDGPTRLALIDQYGYILRPKVAAKFTLPVITGVKESESLESRRARINRAMEMLKDVGPLAGQISEVDVSDPNNLVVAEHVGGAVVNLMVGEDNYADRLKLFLAKYDEIKEQRPDARTLDLRVDGVITALGDNRFER